MNARDYSLILGNGTQLSLEVVDELGIPPEAYAEGEARGRFTGDRLFFQNPKLYHAIVRLLARGLPYREVAEICQVSTNTVCGVSAREGVPVETLRERIARLGFDVAELTMEAIRDLLADPLARREMGLKDLAIVHGIAVQNAQLLAGAATARIEVGKQVEPTHADYLRLLAEAQAEAAKRERNITPVATGLSAESPEQKALATSGVPTTSAEDIIINSNSREKTESEL